MRGAITTSFVFLTCIVCTMLQATYGRPAHARQTFAFSMHVTTHRSTGFPGLDLPSRAAVLFLWSSCFFRIQRPGTVSHSHASSRRRCIAMMNPWRRSHLIVALAILQDLFSSGTRELSEPIERVRWYDSLDHEDKVSITTTWGTGCALLHNGINQ